MLTERNLKETIQNKQVENTDLQEDNTNLIQIIKYKEEDYDKIKSEHRTSGIKNEQLINKNLVL